MKKLIMAIMTSAILLTGCMNPKNTVFVAAAGMPGGTEIWQQVFDEFTRETGIKVKLEGSFVDSPSSVTEIAETLAAKKKKPDVVIINSDYIQEFASRNLFIPIDGVSPEDYFGNLSGGLCTYGGKFICAPLNADAGILYYRKDLVKNAPKTLAELVKTSKDISRKSGRAGSNRYGYVWQGAPDSGLVENFLEFAAAEGGGIRYESGRVFVNSPENVKAIMLMRDIAVKDRVSPPMVLSGMRPQDTASFFTLGNAVFERNSAFFLQQHFAEGSGVKDKTGIAAVPGPSAGRNAASIWCYAAGISANSIKKENAVKFIKYLTSAGVQKGLAISAGIAPSRKDVYNDPDIIAAYPDYPAIAGFTEAAAPKPAIPFYSRTGQVLRTRLNEALMGRKNAEEALKTAENEISDIVAYYTK